MNDPLIRHHIPGRNRLPTADGTGVPETFVIDKRGVIRYVAVQRVGGAEFYTLLVPLLAE